MNAKNFLYAAVGVGDLAVEKTRKALTRASELDTARIRTELPQRMTRLGTKAQRAGTKAIGQGRDLWGSLVNRGEITFKSIRRSAPTKRAVSQLKIAGSQTKAAATSVRKAAAASTEAAKNVASKL
jgi:hypothetical protein